MPTWQQKAACRNPEPHEACSQRRVYVPILHREHNHIIVANVSSTFLSLLVIPLSLSKSGTRAAAELHYCFKTMVLPSRISFGAVLLVLACCWQSVSSQCNMCENGGGAITEQDKAISLPGFEFIATCGALEGLLPFIGNATTECTLVQSVGKFSLSLWSAGIASVQRQPAMTDFRCCWGSTNCGNGAYLLVWTSQNDLTLVALTLTRNDLWLSFNTQCMWHVPQRCNRNQPRSRHALSSFSLWRHCSYLRARTVLPTIFPCRR